MDRLSAVARRPVAVALLFAAASLAAACGTEEPAGPVELPARVNAVKATKPTASASEWCDVHYEPGRGPRLAVPQVEDARSGGTAGGPSGGGWIWVNLWATWCGPCLREMPLITRWMEALKRDGVAVDLWFLSIDEEPAVLRSFLAERPTITPYNSLRLSRQETLRPWLGSLGLPPDTAIPVNVLAGPGGAVRCVRTGAINDGHYPTIREILGDR
ncbi:MAG: TlpA family protein disulfide reductase [Proteobacteria bacterium]|jgi:thiol-disulfide isomerase/thioredoxin|nr:TlpA family protein disulfide reductase [Pseudomonadota bacterium]